MSHKSWCYTINNYTDQDINQLKAFVTNRHRCAKEVGESGTPHLQGTITFPKSMRLTAIKKLLPRAHLEPCKQIDASLNYCTKGEIVIDTTNNEQGKRSDLDNAIDILKSKGLTAVAEETPTIFVKYSKGLSALQQRLLLKSKNDFVTEVHVFWGKAGVGKSRRCREICNDIYNVPEPINGTVWFDNYDGEEAILLDDFYGWLKYHTLLQFTDRYPLQVPVKGGFVCRQWTKVFITSNDPPEDWYHRDEIDALNRRITSVTHLT